MRHYRYLFDQLVRRELRQKYKGTFVGVLWYLVNPLVLMAVYGVVLGTLLHAVTVPYYWIFILGGLLVWLFFSQALIAASTSLVDQAGLIGKVAFPRATVPTAAVVVQLVPFFAMLVVLVPLSLILRGNDAAPLVLLPFTVLCLVAFTLGLSLIAAPLHAYFRDVQPILNALLMPWFFISGVLFPINTAQGLSGYPWARDLLQWGNPIAPFITAFREIIYSGSWPSLATLLYMLGAGALAAAAGWALFRRLSAELAVVI
jgi:ABC-type polysaccharide/polyol phosphate export permease